MKTVTCWFQGWGQTHIFIWLIFAYVYIFWGKVCWTIAMFRFFFDLNVFLRSIRSESPTKGQHRHPMMPWEVKSFPVKRCCRTYTRLGWHCYSALTVPIPFEIISPETVCKSMDPEYSATTKLIKTICLFDGRCLHECIYICTCICTCI